jgi:hypothetical protein
VQASCRAKRPRLQTLKTDGVAHRVACPVIIKTERIATYE